jgi:hypothetical protein
VIHPSQVAFFVPPGLRGFKQDLFDRIGRSIKQVGGRVVEHSFRDLEDLSPAAIPIVGCTYELKPLIAKWRKQGRTWIYWDRGYARRVLATCLPRGDKGGYYRWHVNRYQMGAIRDVPDDRWRSLKLDLIPWVEHPKGHVVVAAPSRSYCRFHGCESWIADTIDALARVTDRQLVIRDKEQYQRRPIQKDLIGAHALVTHASNAAVESVILGTPVFVHPDSAAALVGLTDLSKIEQPIYPDRHEWLSSLAYCQFSERELTDGTLWRLMA